MSLEAWGDEPWGAEDAPDVERLLGEGYRHADDMTQAAHDVLDERLRQRDVEGWTPAHDDEHAEGEMARAAACYAIAGGADDFTRDGRNPNDPPNAKLIREYENFRFTRLRELWPWDWSWWKPKDRRRDLVRAAALLIAEIERLDPAEAIAPSVSEERAP